MSERMGKPGARPREGIYLEAALAVIGEQVDERIDELSRRRRLRSRITIGALSVFAIASTSVAAVAITSASVQHDSATRVGAAAIEHELHCIAGPSPHLPAYFTTRYEATASVSVDPVAVCGAAYRSVTAPDADFGSLTPSQLVIFAAGLLDEASTSLDLGAENDIHVLEASFRRPTDDHDSAPTVVCERGGVVTVLEGSGRGSGQTDAAQCSGVTP